MSENKEDPLKKFLPEGDEDKSVIDATDAIKRARGGEGSGGDLILATLDAAVSAMTAIAMGSAISPQLFVHILSGAVGGCVGGMMGKMDAYSHSGKSDFGHKQLPDCLEIARVNMEAAGSDGVNKEAVSVKLSANLEIPAGSSPEAQVAKLIDTVFDLLGQAGRHVAADSCSVSCSIASSLLAAVVNNGHPACACNACGNAMSYAMGALLSGKPDKSAMH